MSSETKPFIDLKITQGTPEWFDLKFKSVTATDAAPIMGLSPWNSRDRLLIDKREKVMKPQNAAMKRGIEMEPLAMSQFEKMTGIYMSTGRTFANRNIPWQTCSPDGISFEEDVLVEIKCGGKKLHQDAKEEIIPLYYQCQMQHQMCVFDLQKAFYFSFDGFEGIIIELERDREFIQDILEAEGKFYREMMPEISWHPAYAESQV
jgi:putative phage-type endonuclease